MLRHRLTDEQWGMIADLLPLSRPVGASTRHVPLGNRLGLNFRPEGTATQQPRAERSGVSRAAPPWVSLQSPSRIFSSGQGRGHARLQKTLKKGSIAWVESVQNPACWSGSALHDWRKT